MNMTSRLSISIYIYIFVYSYLYTYFQIYRYLHKYMHIMYVCFFSPSHTVLSDEFESSVFSPISKNETSTTQILSYVSTPKHQNVVSDGVFLTWKQGLEISPLCTLVATVFILSGSEGTQRLPEASGLDGTSDGKRGEFLPGAGFR